MGIGLDLNVTTEEFGTDNRQWLGSSHGTQSTRNATITDPTELLAAFPDGQVPSGIPLVVTATGAASAATGLEVPTAYLYSGVKVRAGRRTGVAVIERGRIRRQFLPTAIATTGVAPLFTYVDV